MELFKHYTPDTYIKTAYLYMRNTISRAYIYLILIKTSMLCFEEMNDAVMLLEILIPTLLIGSFAFIIILESYGVSKKKLLFIYSEAINIVTYLYGFYIKPSYKDVFMLTSAVITCGLQLVGSSYFENILIIFKLILVWFIGPILLGYQKIPKDPTPYLESIIIFTVISNIFTYRKNIEVEYAKAILTIQKMKTQLSKIIYAMPESVIIFSEKQEVLIFNLACQRLFSSK